MIRLLIVFFIITSCVNNKRSQNLEDFDFDEKISIIEFKKKLILYGKSSQFPDINK